MFAEDGSSEVSVAAVDKNEDLNSVNIEIDVLGGVSLGFTEGDSCKLVEHAIRSQNNIRGGALQKDGKIYLGSTLFLPGSYVFIGGKVCQMPGEGWAKRKGAKCPCC